MGGGREGWQPPAPLARTLMGTLTPVSSIKHIKVSDKFHINQTSGQSVNATLSQTNWRLYVWKNLHDNKDRGKIKVQKYQYQFLQDCSFNKLQSDKAI